MFRKPVIIFVPRQAIFPGLSLLIIFMIAMKDPSQIRDSMTKTYTYLALGDSYTIGEQVEAKDNFPNQTRAIINKKEAVLDSPQILAQTGWTTDELQAAINRSGLKEHYDFVSLLIGVNNQYRGKKIGEYIPEFEALLKRAIQFAGGKPDHVIVLSIPDWGVTPFAAGRDQKQIAKEIDEYNSANEIISNKYNVHYINITQSTRQAAGDLSLLASDGLHPSSKEYAVWAKKLAEIIQEKL
jgi:lysophospholipase L1-like esterase